MNFTLEQSIEVLENTPSTLEGLLKGTSTIWRLENEGDGTWNATEVVSHLILAEKNNWIPRINIILSDCHNKKYSSFERMHESKEVKSMDELLLEFRTVRMKNLDILKSKNITQADLLKIGFHPEFGEVTLAQQISTWCVHDLGHISQICRVMAYQYRKDVGPWKKYISIVNRK